MNQQEAERALSKWFTGARDRGRTKGIQTASSKCNTTVVVEHEWVQKSYTVKIYSVTFDLLSFCVFISKIQKILINKKFKSENVAIF